MKVITTTTATIGYLPRDSQSSPISAFAAERADGEVIALTRLGRKGGREGSVGRMLEGVTQGGSGGGWILVHEHVSKIIVEAVRGPAGERLGWAIWE